MIKGKPFVKWAGGKRQIIDKLKKYVNIPAGVTPQSFQQNPNLAYQMESEKQYFVGSVRSVLIFYGFFNKHLVHRRKGKGVFQNIMQFLFVVSKTAAGTIPF